MIVEISRDFNLESPTKSDDDISMHDDDYQDNDDLTL